jgi:NADPH2:quinone reductase
VQAVEVTDYGGPDVLDVAECPAPEPGPGEIVIDVEAAGVNFADIEKRRGDYPETPDPPFVPGMEAAGRISDAGPGVDCDIGERVVCLGREAFAERMAVDAETVLRVPPSLATTEAAAVPVQWLTAHNCLFEWGGLDPGETVLVHAAAGGVGTAAVQLASAAGATVIGTASTASKLAFAAENGLDYGINYEEASVADALDDHTEGEGPDLVLDGVGGSAFRESVEALADCGRVVTYGMASGRPGTVATPRLFFANRSVIGYHLEHALAHDRERVLQASNALYEFFDRSDGQPRVDATYDLREAPAAYRRLESRSSRGKVVLEP